MNQKPEDPIKQQGLITDFLAFLKEEKIWWILPLIVLLGLLALVAILGQSSPILAPFIYPFA
jgi:hypothetical protein